MVVVLPAPLTPTTRTTAGGSATRTIGAFAGLQNFEQVLADQILQLAGIGQLVALHALANALQNLAGGM